jgi:hypothetical protein
VLELRRQPVDPETVGRREQPDRILRYAIRSEPIASMKAETLADAMAPTPAVPHRQHFVNGAVRTASARTGLVLVLLAAKVGAGHRIE